MITHSALQILPHLIAMKSFLMEDIFIAGYDNNFKLIDSQFIGEENKICSAFFDKEKLIKIMSDKKYKYLLIAHNHPCSSSSPSDEDIDFTSQIHSLCEDMGVIFLDHLIISAKPASVFSFKKSSLLKESELIQNAEHYIDSLYAELKNWICGNVFDYNLIIRTISVIKEHTEEELRVYEKSPVKTITRQEIINILLQSTFIKENYFDDYAVRSDFYQSNIKTVEELKRLYNNGEFLNENDFKIVKYYKWLQSDKFKKIKSKLLLFEILIVFTVFIGPLIVSTFVLFIGEVCLKLPTSFLGSLFTCFMISAFASPVLLPIEILLNRMFCNILDDKYYTFIEQHFGIKIDRSTKVGDIATVALATKTHVSLSNALKKGSWIEK